MHDADEFVAVGLVLILVLFAFPFLADILVHIIFHDHSYAAFGIQCPESIPLVDGMLVYSPPAAVVKEKKAKAPLTGKPGRPRKNPLPGPATAPKKRGPRKNPIPEQTAAPKKRGRPRKNPI